MKPQVLSVNDDARVPGGLMRILFVDDDASVLAGLKRMLHPLSAKWSMTFVASAAEALDALSREAFDAVVTDMRMPGMNGAELLEQVMKLHPNTIRFILSGHSDQHLILKTVGSAHQYLAKPCDSATLKSALSRAFALRSILADPTLEQLVAQLDSLPSFPSVYTDLLDELKSPDPSIQRVGEIVSEDIGMTAKVLQLVNSAFFGLPRQITTPALAASLLGLDIIRTILLSIHVFTQFKPHAAHGFSADALWRHSVTVGALARKIAEVERSELKVVSDSLTAGMLHDAGRLLLAASMPDRFDRALEKSRKDGITLDMAERHYFSTSHAEIGAYLMGLWAFPDDVVEALALHHRPEKAGKDAFSALTAVHAADAIAHEMDPAPGSLPACRINDDYIEKLGLAERLPLWREACQEITEGEDIEDKTESPVC